MPVQLKSRWPEVAAGISAAVDRGLVAVGDEMKFRLIAELNEPKAGRIYHRGDRVHQASAPGESPATDTEALERSITVTPEPKAVAVETSSPYAAALEFGSSRIAPRPMWSQVAEEMRSRVSEAIANEIRKVR